MSPVAGKITALMTAAACMENNNNSGTISVKADIFAAGGRRRGDGGRKEGRVKAHPAIPNLRPNQWRDWHRFPLARSRPLSAVLHFVRKTAGVTFAAAAGDGIGIGGIAGVAACAPNDCRVPVGRKSRAEERVRTARRGEARSGQGRAG